MTVMDRRMVLFPIFCIIRTRTGIGRKSNRPSPPGAPDNRLFAQWLSPRPELAEKKQALNRCTFYK